MSKKASGSDRLQTPSTPFSIALTNVDPQRAMLKTKTIRSGNAAAAASRSSAANGTTSARRASFDWVA